MKAQTVAYRELSNDRKLKMFPILDRSCTLIAWPSITSCTGRGFKSRLIAELSHPTLSDQSLVRGQAKAEQENRRRSGRTQARPCWAEKERATAR